MNMYLIDEDPFGAKQKMPPKNTETFYMYVYSFEGEPI